MSKKHHNLFHVSTTLISLLLAFLGIAGVYLTPLDMNFIIIGVGSLMLIAIFYGKLQQIEENAQGLAELSKRLNTERRFARLEREIAEQRIRLSMEYAK